MYFPSLGETDHGTQIDVNPIRLSVNNISLFNLIFWFNGSDIIISSLTKTLCTAYHAQIAGIMKKKVTSFFNKNRSGGQKC